MYLVLIETSGNQNYIFSTNKLKENIGASELTYRAGTKWVLDAVAEVNNIPQLSLWTKFGSEELRRKLLNLQLNRRIEDSEENRIEVIIATSGKALLLARNKEDAQKIIQIVTYKALIQAPGLDICGVYEKFDWSTNKLEEINSKVHEKFEAVRSQRPSPNLRFLRLPVIDECSTSGLPASKLEEFKEDGKSKVVLRSQVSSSKRKYNIDGFKRIEELLKREKPNIKFARSVRVLDEEFRKQKTSDDNQEDSNSQEKLDRPLEWLAVVHADGNGLGEIFLNFGEYTENNRDYVDKYRKFSLALDECTERAFLLSLDAFKGVKDGLIPVIPLILGGDDLTVICDGKSALNFIENFLINFEIETNSQEHFDGIIPIIAKQALKVERLSACAGIAIIKPHFPFSVAYDLAEDLMQSAKNVKKKVVNATNKPYPCSALDFHILYDSSDVEFKIIRDKLEINNPKEKTLLHTRPYVVTDISKLKEANGKDWAEFHSWKKLNSKVEILVATDVQDKDKRKLPNSQMHDLRTGLFLGKEVADARYKLIRDRYRNQEIVKLAGSEDSLFEKEPTVEISESKNKQESVTEIYMTGLLDAIDVAEFLDIRDNNNGQ
ncbi:MAG: hypothetical protein KME60_30170 [Cyanomargarita calcarea GSE-NOS-MK-12-04C]|jgi:hypothetical protein|uniref:Cas10/Cmr2 second palm domain-containing protein n=1 Tax=Cyanomargarita calcarea GSE-NOS-MK-12-04C TaxID=2839659 RepID=A0A951UVV7_9CYAN|nr:hypothetical protein [Cyanomargarita calcarea GSE-NOS-MK-12-04C]